MSSDTLFLNDENTLYGRMKTACQEDWHNYCHHPFVLGMADGSLPIASFRHYLQQDYLFLIHFARAYSLAVYKSDNLEDMRSASESVSGILGEMTLHLAYCREWGLTEKDVVSLPEARANMAYTRYVLERGMAGDILDLYTALSPCAVGYAEIGYRLKNDPDTLKEGNPYWAWIETYGGKNFLAVPESRSNSWSSWPGPVTTPPEWMLSVRLSGKRPAWKSASGRWVWTAHSNVRWQFAILCYPEVSNNNS
ncbi:TenA family protein [Endozoicomonas sp. GU-1]|uniref:TenA family protein n=1 Tax=Endozoicomonas sp. GU-1 TaxID=3009078 RepID=UPI0022B44C65|nr:TenA family protein [Endozoicomonas sp. GU-1]WBA82334.1 TenA family protein [Endozoicomonas sp. GU-1]